MYDHILIRYGELALKKTNRNQFVTKVTRNIKRALRDYPLLKYQDNSMRFYIILNGTDPNPLIPLLEKIPGIYSFSIVYRCEPNLDDICINCKTLLLEEFADGMKTMKIETNRGDKSFPMTSIEISKEIGRYLFKNIPNLKADVHTPEVTLNVDLRKEGAFIFTKTFMGLGGLPAGSLGKGLLMVSGGIDSVVAGFMAIKKGITIEAVHFASPPYTSDQAVQKVIDLLEKICPYSEFQSITLHIIPFTKIQQAIYENVRDDYGITIMRRMMYRITSQLCEERNAVAIINGENVGQVASQTLESMACIGEVTNVPIIRPLATFDKKEIIDIALNIDTYDISIRPYEDCCTVFVPRHPQIKPLATKARSEEIKFDFEPLIKEAILNKETIYVKSNHHYELFNQNNEIEDIF